MRFRDLEHVEETIRICLFNVKNIRNHFCYIRIKNFITSESQHQVKLELEKFAGRRCTVICFNVDRNLNPNPNPQP